MARHLFDVGINVGSQAASVTIYTDAACTTVADIQTPAGVAISGAVIAVANNRRVTFLGPNNVRTVYTKPSTDTSIKVTLTSLDAGDATTDEEIDASSTNASGAFQPVDHRWSAGLAVKTGQLIENGGTIYRATADFTTPGSFNTTNLTAISGGGGSSNVTSGTVNGQIGVWSTSTGKYEPTTPSTVTATDVPFTPTGTIAATNVGAALGEVASEAAQKAANLSDLASAATARTNLGLGGAAVLSVGTTAGTVAAGDDSRFSGGSSLTVQDEGGALATAATTLNFVGSGVTATGTGATKTITIAGASSPAITARPKGTDNAVVGIIPGADVSTSSTITPTSGNIRYDPMIVVGSTITVDAILSEVTTAGGAGGTYRQGVYNADGDWQPTSLVAGTDTGDIDASTTGVKTGTLSSPVALAPGRYVLTTHSQSGAVLRSPVTNGPNLGYVAGSSTGFIKTLLASTGAVATGVALPSTGTKWTSVTTGTVGLLRAGMLRLSAVSA